MNKLIVKLISAYSSVLLMLSFGANASAEVQKLILKNDHIQAEITPDIGGRLLSIGLVGKPNFLRVGEPVISNPNPVVNANAENIGYLGHEIWVGPQSEWWVHQNINQKRATEKAVWPPDPYLILAKNKVLEQSRKKVSLLSAASPISGVELLKTYSLVKNKRNSLQLSVNAKNSRTENIAWDIWFNTRVYPDTQVYVPVADAKDIQVKNLEDETYGSIEYSLNKGIFTLEIQPTRSANFVKQKPARKGKIMIQPSHGWMAGFRGDQVFIIQFDHQEKSKIHPEQGQIELYTEYFFNDLNNGLLEMEVHAPYKTLGAGETMSAKESWTLLEYNGDKSRDAQVEFLRNNAKRIGLLF
ncbi:MAG: DUF4380 domain-containing protein [Gammaproteobacteria bacterium]|nr:MAG: DUF4380 domain-containing protein [Gammaproteobacteria bacterium]